MRAPQGALSLVNFERLGKILQHEIQLGCANKGVIGGLESFVAHWQTESLAAGATGEEQARINSVVSAIEGYANLDPIERNRVLTEVLNGFTSARAESRSPAAQPAPVMTAPAMAQRPAQPEKVPDS